MDAEHSVSLFSTMAKNCRKLRVFATSALQVCLVAAGSFDFYVTDNVHIWDFAAAVLILTEAGGKVTDMKGKPISIFTEKIIATNGKIQTQILSKLKGRK